MKQKRNIRSDVYLFIGVGSFLDIYEKENIKPKNN